MLISFPFAIDLNITLNSFFTLVDLHVSKSFVESDWLHPLDFLKYLKPGFKPILVVFLLFVKKNLVVFCLSVDTSWYGLEWTEGARSESPLKVFGRNIFQWYAPRFQSLPQQGVHDYITRTVSGQFLFQIDWPILFEEYLLFKLSTYNLTKKQVVLPNCKL